MIPRIKTSVETRQLFTDAQCEVVEARIGRNSKAFFIRIRDPGCKKFGSGIRDKHPVSSTLPPIITFQVLRLVLSYYWIVQLYINVSELFMYKPDRSKLVYLICI
jgi:hypothetical protein